MHLLHAVTIELCHCGIETGFTKEGYKGIVSISNVSDAPQNIGIVVYLLKFNSGIPGSAPCFKPVNTNE